jgi:hypothetical protein
MGLVGRREIDVKLERFAWHRESDDPAGIEEIGSFSHREDHLPTERFEKLGVSLQFRFADEEKLTRTGIDGIVNPANFVAMIAKGLAGREFRK